MEKRLPCQEQFPFPLDKAKRILIPGIRSSPFPMNLNRYPQPYRIFNLKPGSSRETIFVAQKGIQEITCLNQSEPRLLSSWNIPSTSILFLDDCIISSTTARLCYEIQAAFGESCGRFDLGQYGSVINGSSLLFERFRAILIIRIEAICLSVS